MTDRFQLICVSIILALLLLSGIVGFFRPSHSPASEIVPPSRYNAPALAEQLRAEQLSRL